MITGSWAEARCRYGCRVDTECDCWQPQRHAGTVQCSRTVHL